MNIFYIKFFLETLAETECESALEHIISILPKSYREKSRTIEQYWKIPEYMKVELICEIVQMDKITFESTCELLGSGWEFTYPQQEMEAIWNPSKGNRFNIANVCWSLISCY